MTTQQVSSLLLALALISLLAFGAGTVAQRLRQPPVVGEVLLGVLLGPTFLTGIVADTLFPKDIRPFLAALANIGVALFMFSVGAELNASLLRGRRIVAGSVAAGSIALPFGLGALLALYLFTGHPTGNRTGFVLFMGAAMSVTAFPVLARIIVDRGLNQTWLGNVALACAAIDDVLAWSLLAVVVAISAAGVGSQWLLLLFLPYLLLMAVAVRPVLRRWLERRRVPGDRTPATLVITLAGLLASAAFTEWIGLHFIFGAFFFGVIMPRVAESDQRPDITGRMTERISHLNDLLLLPIFFIVAGLRVDLSNMDGQDVLDLVLVLAVAVGGKFVGAFVAARLRGLRSRAAGALAVLMNTRGLTELIILSVGLQLGVLDGKLYSAMVVMALVTTAMAGPLLRLIHPMWMVSEGPRGDRHAPASAVTAVEGPRHPA